MRVVRSRYRIIYGDTDAMGLAYYGNYFRWFEMGRNEWLRDLGLTYAEIETAGTYAPVTQAYCHYLTPARYDDAIWVETDVEYVRKASIKFVYRIEREADGEEIVTGYTVHAFVNKEGKIVRTPTALLELVARMEKPA
jgi:acyl-CoA thioester hydrolase